MTYSKTESLFDTWQGNRPFMDRARQMLGSSPTDMDWVEASFRAQNPMQGYTYVSDQIRRGISEADLIPLLLWNISQFEDRFSATRLDPEFRLQYADAYHRLMDRIEAGQLVASFDNDSFMKELGLARLTMIPAVAQIIYPHAGLQLRPVIKGGLQTWAYVWVRCEGRRPFFDIHTHDPWAKDYFNLPGWDETYRLAALALRSFPQHNGVFGSSWFYDPQLRSVSPRLSYLQTEPLKGGARLIRLGTFEDTLANALATSPTRRALHDEGKFTPVAYAMVWSRKDIMRAYEN